MNEKFNELMQNEAFVEKLFALENDTEVRDLLTKNGVELSLAEIAAIKTGLDFRFSKDGELSEDDLENVAGGYASDLIRPLVLDIAINVDGRRTADRWSGSRRW